MPILFSVANDGINFDNFVLIDNRNFIQVVDSLGWKIFKSHKGSRLLAFAKHWRQGKLSFLSFLFVDFIKPNWNLKLKNPISSNRMSTHIQSVRISFTKSAYKCAVNDLIDTVISYMLKWLSEAHYVAQWHKHINSFQ